MDKPSVKFRTPSADLSSEQKAASRPASKESVNTTRTRFLNAPEVPISNEETRKREEKMKELEKQKQRRKKTKKKKLTNQQMPETDDERKRAQELQERHMRALDDLAKLRNHYYLEYKDKLDAKVMQQRKDIHKKSEELKKKIEQKKQKEMEASQQVKKRMHRSLQAVDNTFLKSLPKSRLYQVMVHQSKLMRDGKLNSLEDIEQFWHDVGDPDTFHRMMEGDAAEMVSRQEDEEDRDDVDSLGSNHSDSSAPGSRTSSLSSLHQYDRTEGGHTLSRIAETREPTNASMSRCNTINEPKQPVPLTKNKSFKSSRKSVHPKVAEMEQRYPRVDFPNMLALYMDLDPPKEDPEILEMRHDYQQKSRAREKEKKRLRKMYELSLTHQASTQRLFDKNEDFSQVINSLCIADVGGLLHSGEDPEPEPEPDYYPVGYPSYNPSVVISPQQSHQQRKNSHPIPLSEITRLLEDTIPEEREEDLTEGSLSRHSIMDGVSGMGRRKKHSSSRLSRHGQVESRGSSYSGGSRESSANSHHTRRTDRHLEPIAGRKPTTSVPLTIDTVMAAEETVIKDVTCLSTLWTNYARDLPAVR